MSTFDEKTFIHAIALRQAQRLRMAPADLAACFDAHEIVLNTAPAQFIWPVPREGMASECWIIARMSADVRQMIADAQFIEADPDAEGTVCEIGDSRTVGRDDLIELGWPADIVRSYAAVALANALASFKAEAEAITARRQFTGFHSTTASLATLTVFAIGLFAAGVATLV